MMANKDTKVCVAVRIRPLIERESQCGLGNNWSAGGNIIQQLDPETGSFVSNSLPYVFDHVFDRHTKTSEVYKEIVAPIVRYSLNGFNGTILCYGQTSSGKTYTLFGSDTEKGIISLAAEDLFKHISEDESRTYIIRVGLIEIYKEKVQDMLNPGKAIEIKEINGVIAPKDLEEIEVLKPDDLLKAAKRVQQQRKIGETDMNKESSRSHTILRIVIESVPRRDIGVDCESDEVHVTNALLNFVDLAGSEKVGQTGVQGERLKEATYINKSLSVLSQVVMQLSGESTTGSQDGCSNMNSTMLLSVSKPRSKFASFRDSKLTRILQSSLNGNAYIVMICNVTPAPSSVEETHSTLRFAKTAKKIKTEPKANHILTASAKYQQRIKELQELLGGKSSEVDELKRQLGIYMNFCHNKRNLSSSAVVNCPPTDAKRRKTWCPSQSNLIRGGEQAVNPRENSKNDPDLLTFTPVAIPPPSGRVLRSHSRSSLQIRGGQCSDSDESFMSPSEALKHFKTLSEKRSRDFWQDEEDGLLSKEELRKMKFDAHVQTETKSSSRSPCSPVAKRQRHDEVPLTPVVTLQKVRADLTTALRNDKLDWETEKAFLEAELAQKTTIIEELKAFFGDLTGIRNLGEQLHEALTQETVHVSTSTDELATLKDASTFIHTVSSRNVGISTESSLTEDTGSETCQFSLSNIHVTTSTDELKVQKDASTFMESVSSQHTGICTEIRETHDAASETGPFFQSDIHVSTSTDELQTLKDSCTSMGTVSSSDASTFMDAVSSKDVWISTESSVTENIGTETCQFSQSNIHVTTSTDELTTQKDASTFMECVSSRHTGMCTEIRTTHDASSETAKFFHSNIHVSTSTDELLSLKDSCISTDSVLLRHASTLTDAVSSRDVTISTESSITEDTGTETCQFSQSNIHVTTSTDELTTRNDASTFMESVSSRDAEMCTEIRETHDAASETGEFFQSNIHVSTSTNQPPTLKDSCTSMGTVSSNDVSTFMDVVSSRDVWISTESSITKDTGTETCQFSQSNIHVTTSTDELTTRNDPSTFMESVSSRDAEMCTEIRETHDAASETGEFFQSNIHVSTSTDELLTLKDSCTFMGTVSSSDVSTFMDTVSSRDACISTESSITEDTGTETCEFSKSNINVTTSTDELTTRNDPSTFMESVSSRDAEMCTEIRETHDAASETGEFFQSNIHVSTSTNQPPTLKDSCTSMGTVSSSDVSTFMDIVSSRDACISTESSITEDTGTETCEFSKSNINVTTSTDELTTRNDASTFMESVLSRDAEMCTEIRETHDAASETGEFFQSNIHVSTSTNQPPTLKDSCTSMGTVSSSDVSTFMDVVSSRDVWISTESSITEDAGTETCQFSLSNIHVTTSTDELTTRNDASTFMESVSSRDAEVCTEIRETHDAASETGNICQSNIHASTSTDQLPTLKDSCTSMGAVSSSDVSTFIDIVSSRDAWISTESSITKDTGTETCQFFQSNIHVTTSTDELTKQKDASTFMESVSSRHTGMCTEIRATNDAASETSKFFQIIHSSTSTDQLPAMKDSCTFMDSVSSRDISVSTEVKTKQDADRFSQSSVHPSSHITVSSEAESKVDVMAFTKDFGRLVSRVNRGIQTSEESDLRIQLRDLQILVKVRERELSDLKYSTKMEAGTTRVQITKLENKLVDMNLEADLLKQTINLQTSSMNCGVKRKVNKIDSEIQCDYIIEQAKRAITGERGILPKGFPDIGDLTKEVKLLRQTNFVLDIQNQKCTCKGESKNPILVNPLARDKPEHKSNFRTYDTLRSGRSDVASGLASKIFRTKPTHTTSISESTGDTSSILTSAFTGKSPITSSSSLGNHNQRYRELIAAKDFKPPNPSSVLTSERQIRVPILKPASIAPHVFIETETPSGDQECGQTSITRGSYSQIRPPPPPVNQTNVLSQQIASKSHLPFVEEIPQTQEQWANELEELLMQKFEKKS